MITDKDIARINELYHKSKNEGLTPEEKQEQAHLRGAYITAIRKNLRGNLERIQIQNPDGTVENVKDRLKRKRNIITKDIHYHG